MKFIAPLILFLACVCVFGISYVDAVGLPFGGIVLSTVTCDEGMLVVLGPPTAGTYMWPWGESTYAYFNPPHINQWLLGEYLAVLTCTIGPETVAVAPMILFHGSSY